MWQELRKVITGGVKDYFLSWNNVVNSVQNILYVASFSLKYYAMYMVSLHKARAVDPDYWAIALNSSITDTDVQLNVIFRPIFFLNLKKVF